MKMKKFKWYLRKIVLLLSDLLKRILLAVFPRPFLRRMRRVFFNDNWKVSIFKHEQFDVNKYARGINVFGYFKARMGLGQGARSILSALIRSDIPYSVINFKVGNSASHKEKYIETLKPGKIIYSINLFLVNIGQMDFLYQLYQKSSWDFRYNIGYWLWEMTTLPEDWRHHIEFIDEIWVPTKFIRDMFAKETHKPIHIIPYVIEPTIDVNINGKDFGFADNRFVYLVMFDSLSTIERKNPIDAITAYMDAFQENEDTLLIIKINNCLDEDIETINKIIRNRTDIHLIKEEFDVITTHSLINLSNVFISLHRSEGFGMVIAESMYFGKLVIATNWSGNTDFMNRSNAFPIDYELVELDKDANMYKKGNTWAQPDIKQATKVILDVYLNYSKYDTIRIKAMKDIRNSFSKNVVYNKIIERYNKILENGEQK